MNGVIRGVYLLAVCAWVGAVLFFSLLVLPMLFTSLDSARAGEIAALLFPPYYRAGLACAFVVLATLSYFVFTVDDGRARRGWMAALAVTAVMSAAQAYATFVVHPRVAEIRGVESQRAEFDALHGRSVRLNAIVLLGGLVLVGASGSLLARRP